MAVLDKGRIVGKFRCGNYEPAYGHSSIKVHTCAANAANGERFYPAFPFLSNLAQVFGCHPDTPNQHL